MGKDPICGMDVDPKKALKNNLILKKGKQKYYFCSKVCLDKFKQKNNRVFSITLSIILISIASLAILNNLMLFFMGSVFLIISLLKFLDLKGFSKAFSQYDLIASKSPTYAKTYPFIELGLGLMYLLQFQIELAAIITIFIMGIGALGIAKNLLKKESLNCACLGTKIKVPLTSFTLVEDLIMVLMALMLLSF